MLCVDDDGKPGRDLVGQEEGRIPYIHRNGNLTFAVFRDVPVEDLVLGLKLRQQFFGKDFGQIRIISFVRSLLQIAVVRQDDVQGAGGNHGHHFLDIHGSVFVAAVVVDINAGIKDRLVLLGINPRPGHKPGGLLFAVEVFGRHHIDEGGLHGDGLFGNDIVNEVASENHHKKDNQGGHLVIFPEIGELFFGAFAL